MRTSEIDPQPARSWGTWALALASALLVAVVTEYVARRANLGPVDDAYISLRYAQNWVAGHGLVYNVGERVEGFSNFAYVALEAALLWSGATPEHAVWWPAAAAHALIAPLLLWLLMRHGVRSRVHAWLVATLIALDPALIAWSRAGLEGPVYTLWVLSALAFALERPVTRTSLTACVIVCVLAAATRPEGLVLLPLSIFTLASDRTARRSVWIACACGVLVCVVGLGARHAYFGHWLPNTYYAKVDGLRVTVAARGAEYVGGALGLYLPRLGLVLAALWTQRPGARTGSPWLRTLLVWLAVLVLTVVFEGGDFFPMYRFLLPVFVLSAIAALGPWLQQVRRHDDKPYARHGAFALTVVALACGWISLVCVPFPQTTHWSQLTAEMGRARLWVSAGEALRACAPPNATIGAVAIGGIGYTSQRRVLDALGLIDAHIAHTEHRLGGGLAGHEKFDNDYFFGQRPDAIILPPAPVEIQLPRAWIPSVIKGGLFESMKRDPRLDRDYTLYYIPVNSGQWLHTFIHNEKRARWNLTSATCASVPAEAPRALAAADGSATR